MKTMMYSIDVNHRKIFQPNIKFECFQNGRKIVRNHPKTVYSSEKSSKIIQIE